MGALLEHDLPATRHLDTGRLAGLSEEMARLGIAGGAVFHAMVGTAARAHGMALLSHDRWARQTYDALGVDVRVIE